jgi:hypothetical protein
MRCPKSKAISSRSRERATEVRKQDLNGRAICCQMAHFLASAKLLLRKDPRNYLGGALPGPQTYLSGSSRPSPHKKLPDVALCKYPAMRQIDPMYPDIS